MAVGSIIFNTESTSSQAYSNVFVPGLRNLHFSDSIIQQLYIVLTFKNVRTTNKIKLNIYISNRHYMADSHGFN